MRVLLVLTQNARYPKIPGAAAAQRSTGLECTTLLRAAVAARRHLTLVARKS